MVGRSSKQSVSDGPATYVVGDIHGCLGSLKQLLRKIEPRGEDEVVFIGDYIDRGPHSREVVDTLLALPYRCVFLMGNHERMLLDFLDGTDEDGLFLLNGGEATLQSYGGDFANMPPSHLQFFRRLRMYYETPDYVFVHAGVRPNVALGAQKPEDLVWIRQEFYLFVGQYPKPVIFGHTPLRKVLDQPDRVGIDTGCVYGGRLTCVKLPERTVIQVPGWRSEGL